jgi:hypothetical protein
LRFTAGLKKFYRGNNTISWVTIANENLTFVVTQARGAASRGGTVFDHMTPLYCRETLL